MQTVPQDSKVVLFHSSSVGEWEQAAPVLKLFKEKYPNLIAIASFFSPSGYTIVKSEHIDYKMYLPFDYWLANKALFKIIKPAFIAVSKYEAWPNFIFQSKAQNIPIILTSAELAQDSSRHKGIARILNKPLYSMFSQILPVSNEYKQRFELIAPSSILEVTGDARYDQIFQKARNSEKEDPIRFYKQEGRLTIALGSAWPEDEEVIFPALKEILLNNKDINLVVAPHEMHEPHIKSIEEFFADISIGTERYTNLQQGILTDARVLILNTIGLLAKVYALSDLAYVGGSFGKGVHNVLEPVAFNQPVVFGPKHVNSYEACQLKTIGGAFSIRTQSDAKAIFEKLVYNNDFRKEAGSVAYQFLEENLGAAEKTFMILEKYL